MDAKGTIYRLISPLLILITGVSISFILIQYSGTLRETKDDVLYEEETFVPEHHFLFLSSYAPSHVNYTNQQKGMLSALYPEHISLDTYFMYTKEYDDTEHLSYFYELLKYRVEHVKYRYDAVLIGDDAALCFAWQYGETLFPEIPLVFFGINDADLARSAKEGDPRITGFIENSFMDSTIDIATRLLPEADQIYALNDSTVTGEGSGKEFMALAASYPDYRFEEINVGLLSYEELCQKLEDLDDRAILLYLNGYRDKTGQYYNIAQTCEILRTYAHVPVFRNYIGGNGMGILGGCIYDMESVAAQAAALAARAVKGEEEIRDVPVASSTRGRAVFDYQMMRKYGLDFSSLPKDTLYLNRPMNVFREYGSVIFPGIVVFFCLLCLYLYTLYRAAQLERSREALLYTTEHDGLTGLVNRRTVIRRLEEQLDRNAPYTIALVDFDNFKLINEFYGHDQGDLFLQGSAKSLEMYREKQGDFCSIARYGGDEFLVCFQGTHLDTESAEITELKRLLSLPMEIPGSGFVRTNVCVGIAESETGASPETIIRHSEMALNEAKMSGRNTASLYDAHLKKTLDAQNQVKQKVDEALEKGGFMMVYQPQIDLKSGKVCGIEALARIRDDIISPAVFIPVAERNGLIRQLGRVITELVIKQIARWRDEGMQILPVSINYSSRQIFDTGYLNYLSGLLQAYQLPASSIRMELTESFFLSNSTETQTFFRELDHLGVRVHMDDFGTGYSSMSYLSYIPAEAVKLDRSLINTYVRREGENEFIRDIIVLLHDLGKTVIAEGVEQAWQRDILRRCSCDVIQGYYYSKPLPAEDIPACIQRFA